MLILLKPDAAAAQRAEVQAALRALGVATEVLDLPGRFAFIAEEGSGVPGESIRRIPGVDQVVPLGNGQAPLIHSTWSKTGRTVSLGGARFGGGHVGVIAGPCTVESQVDLERTARQVAGAGAAALRGGVFKVRTSPHSYQGGGTGALELLVTAAREVGLPFFTELNDPRQVALVGDRLDGVQIGARHMQNFPLLQEVAALGKPVLLKRHMAAGVDEWLLAAEYILAAGNEQVILCERGLKTSERHVRFLLDLGVVPYLKQRIGLPIVVDPSHAAGHHELVPDLARAAVAAGADGLLIEVHPRPETTRCDALQALPPTVFAELMSDVRDLAAMSGRTVSGHVRAMREVPPHSDNTRSRSMGA